MNHIIHFMRPFKNVSSRKTFIHIDGDSFFVSCELTKRPDLKGKPVVTGQERGIVSAMSREAKAQGISRGMSLGEAKKICPDLVLIHSDFSLYEEYSRRMIAIVKRYTSYVERYSIDECFADISDLDHRLGMVPVMVAERIQKDLENELGITFSIGLGATKTIAKVASGYRKPSGLTMVTERNRNEFLKDVSIGDVWGIGYRTAQRLRAWGIVTAFDLVTKDVTWVQKFFSKPLQQIHLELQGVALLSVSGTTHADALSISRTRTFSQASSDETKVFAELSRNVEMVCHTLRRQKQFGKKISLFLKTQQFTYEMAEFQLPYAIATPQEIMGHIRRHFHTLFQKGIVYRATGITVSRLTSVRESTLDLFGEVNKTHKIADIYDSFDEVNNKYGRETIFLGSSMSLVKHESKRFMRKLRLPLLGFVS